MSKILVVEDNLELAHQIQTVLEQNGYMVEVANDGAVGMSLLEDYGFDLVVLDVNLPGKNGFEICKSYRAKGGKSPILFLTDQSDINDKETGFTSGADDYLTKPFNTRELLMRLQALQRRGGEYQGREIRCKHISLLVEQHSVLKNGEPINLLPLEFALLEYFLRHPNQVFSAETLLDRVWKSQSDASELTIRTYIKTLRKKIDLEGERSLIENVYGVGYKLEM